MVRLAEVLPGLLNEIRSLVCSRPSPRLMASGMAVVAAVYLYRATKRRRQRPSLCDRLGGTPGPIPYFGFVPRSSEHFLYGLEILADTYGDTFAIKIMGRESVVSTDYETIKEVHKERPHNLIRAFNKDKLLPIPGMLTAEGEEWKRNRRLAAPALNEHNSAEMVPAMAVVAKRLVRQLRTLDCDGRIVWEPTNWLMLCSLDVLCLSTFGMDFYFLNPDGITVPPGSREIAQSIFHFVEGSIYILDFSAILPSITRNRFPWNLNPIIKKFYASIDRLNKFADDLAVQRRARGEGRERSDLFSGLLQLDKHDFEGNIVTLFFAGSETTSAALSWCLYYFCLYPDAQARARKEVDTLGHDPETNDDLDQLPFVESCILETLRLKSPVPLLVNETTASVSVRGHEVPEGTWIVTLTGKQMRSNAEGGSSFRPQRWLTSYGGVDRARAQEHLAFGSGPRRCPGSNMAIKEGTMVLAMILRHFDNIKHSSDISKVEVKARLTYGPAKLEISMSKRPTLPSMP
ncbi:hypothetical protein FOZ63_020250 [Perkinsus olseni]|uniref:Cytochrome P450 n=1 Tax=Perkinsus olseni TaxID=32597 RepID=A0A7J6UAR8_PEROL|nr:hypothetical protein FOZ63_020250 [Perkinsus olseni]